MRVLYWAYVSTRCSLAQAYVEIVENAWIPFFPQGCCFLFSAGERRSSSAWMSMIRYAHVWPSFYSTENAPGTYAKVPHRVSNAQISASLGCGAPSASTAIQFSYRQILPGTAAIQGMVSHLCMGIKGTLICRVNTEQVIAENIWCAHHARLRCHHAASEYLPCWVYELF